MTDEESEEKNDYARLADWTKKYRYEPVFGVPDEPWKIGALWEDAYFDSAKYVIEGVLKRELVGHVHGVAGVFLFRHYLELAVKFIILHAGWLADKDKLAPPEDFVEIAKIHKLRPLWETAVRECKRTIPEDSWTAWDVEFVEKMILEFHTVDESGFRFRYHGDKFGPGDPLHDLMRGNELRIDYEALLAQMDHARSVLGMIDTYLYETHGMIADWEAEMQAEMGSW
jgi:hypothetical protein